MVSYSPFITSAFGTLIKFRLIVTFLCDLLSQLSNFSILFAILIKMKGNRESVQYMSYAEMNILLIAVFSTLGLTLYMTNVGTLLYHRQLCLPSLV